MELVQRRKKDGSENDDPERIHVDLEEENELESQPSVPIREMIQPMDVKRDHNRSQHLASAFFDKWNNTSNYVKRRGFHFFERVSPWTSHIEDIEAKFGTGTGSYFRSLHRIFALNLLLGIISFGAIIGPQLAYDIIQKNVSNNTLHPMDILTGAGLLSETVMFYGHYNSSITFPSGFTFGTTYVYFYSTLSLYFVAILFTSITMAGLYRKNFIDYVIALDSTFFFTNKVLCGWRSEIRNQGDARLQKYKTSSTLKESLEGNSSPLRNKKVKKRVLAKRFVVNVIIMGLLALSGVVTSWIIDIIHTESSSPRSTLTEIQLSFGISLTLYVLPLIFTYLGKLEEYELPRTAMYFGLIRSVALEKILTVTIFVKNVERSVESESCWENVVGRAIYQLICAYIIILLIGTFALELLHCLVYPFFKRILPPPEFDISRNSTHLIYSQSLALIGYYFVPGLPLLMVIFTVLTFYVKVMSVHLTYSKSRAPWRASRSQTVFMVYTFCSSLVAVVGYLFVIIRLHPSRECGPSREFNHSYEIMGEAAFFRDSFIFKQAFISGAILVLIVGIYYTQSLNRTYIRETKSLKIEISRQKIEQRILKQLLASSEGLSSQ